LGSDPRGAFELRLLGPLEASVDGVPVALGSPKQRALLVHLAHAGEAVTVQRLIDELWPEDPPEAAQHAIQVYVSGLRKALGDRGRITTGARVYALRLEPGELDLERFRSLVIEGHAQLGQEPAGAARQLREALSLWRGRALADLDSEPAVRDLRLDLEDERLQATEILIDAELAAGRHARLVPELERLLTEFPAREKLYEQLMLALYRSGRQGDALDVYQRARTALMEELDLEPGPKLRELEAAVLRQDPSIGFESPELDARRHLPAQPNPLTGRGRELSELIELVASGGVRLVTLTGPAGVGKTRLAIAAAERLVVSFGDGVWFVDLQPVREAGLVVPAIAEALGVPEDDALAGYLRDRELLLVLDGLEHLPDAAPAIGRLVRGAPRLKVLATSREPLNLYGEHRYELLARASAV
jgi:DNA-binding SARP family transcriptional activator